MAEPTLYLFDGHNLFHAGNYEDLRQLRDELASFVAVKGARGVLVFDGSGADETYGPLEVRYAANADTLLERLDNRIQRAVIELNALILAPLAQGRGHLIECARQLPQFAIPDGRHGIFRICRRQRIGLHGRWRRSLRGKFRQLSCARQNRGGAQQGSRSSLHRLPTAQPRHRKFIWLFHNVLLKLPSAKTGIAPGAQHCTAQADRQEWLSYTPIDREHTLINSQVQSPPFRACKPRKRLSRIRLRLLSWLKPRPTKRSGRGRPVFRAGSGLFGLT